MTEDAYQTIVNHTIRWVEYTQKVKVTVNNLLKAGRGYFLEKRIEMPKWIERYDINYRIYYVIHELTHCIVGIEHDDDFKKVEDILLSLWDIRIERKSIYPRKLFCNNKEILNIPYKVNKKGG